MAQVELGNLGSQSDVEKSDLPAVYRAGPQQREFLLPERQPLEYLKAEFSVDKFEQLGQHIWMAGRPFPARPLNIQAVLSRQIVPTNDISLHLVWTTGRIFVKPLPRFLLKVDFLKDNLLPLQGRKHSEVYGLLLGFLWSYVALMPTELDFRIAQKHHLLNIDGESIAGEWQNWRKLTEHVLSNYSSEHRKGLSIETPKHVYDLIPVRYKYGELRLSRLDKISRMKGNVHHGWSSLTGSTRYNDWIVKYFTPIAAAVAYIVVLLSALQVGLATERLNDNGTFQEVSVVFTLLALVTLVAAIGLGVLILLGMFLLNWFKSAVVSRSRDNDEAGSRAGTVSLVV